MALPVATGDTISVDDIQPKETEAQPSDLLIHASGDKTVIAHKNELKLLSNDADMSLLSNYPCSALDKVYLNINLADLKFLYKSSEIKFNSNLESHIANFMKSASASHDGTRCQVRYFDALIAVESLLKHNITRYKKLEELQNEIFINDSVKSAKVKRTPQTQKASMSFTEMN